MGILSWWSLIDLRSELDGETWSGKPASPAPSTRMVDTDDGS